MPLFLLFTVVPLTEIAIFAWVGGQVGVLSTIMMVLVCAVAGSALLRQQGLSTLRRAQQVAAEGRLPSDELADGLVLVVSGVLLLTPGFLTDVIALLLLLPGVRHVVRRWLVKRIVARAQTGGVFVQVGRSPFEPPPARRARDTEVIDEKE